MVLHGNIVETQGSLNFEIGRLCCRVISTEFFVLTTFNEGAYLTCKSCKALNLF